MNVNEVDILSHNLRVFYDKWFPPDLFLHMKGHRWELLNGVVMGGYYYAPPLSQMSEHLFYWVE